MGVGRGSWSCGSSGGRERRGVVCILRAVNERGNNGACWGCRVVVRLFLEIILCVPLA